VLGLATEHGNVVLALVDVDGAGFTTAMVVPSRSRLQDAPAGLVMMVID
jgi:hypothetical protein